MYNYTYVATTLITLKNEIEYQINILKLVKIIINKILNIFQKILNTSSLKLTVIYTIGHIIVAIIVVRIITGASWWDAGAVAMVEPLINGAWFYVLHKVWIKYFIKTSEKKIKP